jgi:integrase
MFTLAKQQDYFQGENPARDTATASRWQPASVVVRVILPALNRCERCSKAESEHAEADHQYKRDERIPEWHGWHAARRGLGSNLYRLGVTDKVIQAILRHANVSTTATYYIKTAADDVRNAMAKLESNIPAPKSSPSGH